MRGRLWFSWVLVGGAVAALIGVPLWATTALSWGVAWVLGATVATFGIYGFDKSAAAGGRRRVPELSLHLLALAGGGFGALAGRSVFRHKTTKREFTVVIGIGIVTTLAIAWIGR